MAAPRRLQAEALRPGARTQDTLRAQTWVHAHGRASSQRAGTRAGLRPPLRPGAGSGRRAPRLPESHPAQRAVTLHMHMTAEPTRRPPGHSHPHPSRTRACGTRTRMAVLTAECGDGRGGPARLLCGLGSSSPCLGSAAGPSPDPDPDADGLGAAPVNPITFSTTRCLSLPSYNTIKNTRKGNKHTKFKSNVLNYHWS